MPVSPALSGRSPSLVFGPKKLPGSPFHVAIEIGDRILGQESPAPIPERTGVRAAAMGTDHDLGSTAGKLIIGGDATDGGSKGFTGLLDEVAIFSGVVS